MSKKVFKAENDYSKKKPRKTGFDLISSGLKKQIGKELKKADMK